VSVETNNTAPTNGDDPEPPRHRWLTKITRDVLIFTVGLTGILHETYFTDRDRPELLLLFAAMIGAPALIRLDESRRK